MKGPFDADVVIVGSGIIGTMSALELQDAGFSVLVIESNEPGAGTAAGSAGYLHDGEIFPVAQPGLLANLPRMLLDPRGPLVFRPSYLPQIAGWGIRFLGAMRKSAIERSIDALASLNRQAVDALFSVAAASNAEKLFVRRGGLKVVCDRRTLGELARELTILERAGISARALDSAQVHALEPSLAPEIAGAVFFPNSAHCTDPQRFGDLLAARVRAKSTVLRARVEALLPRPDDGWIVRLRGCDSYAGITAKRVLVTAGYTSHELLRPLGYNVPVAAARGYHLMIAKPDVQLSHPIIFHEPHIGATPMDRGLRLAGTMEFAAPGAPADFRRAEMLYGIAKRYIPGLHNGVATTWMGIRPSMPDSLPAIGKAKRHNGLYYCFGHGHLGFTQAATSARCISELMSGTPPSVDLAPFDLARFE